MKKQEELKIDLFKEALSETEQQGRIKTFLSSNTTGFLNKYDIPQELVEVLKNFCYSNSILFGNISFREVNDIEEFNSEESISCIENGLLVIGSGMNGDPVVIDVNTFIVGFVFHDELWEKPEVNARDIFVPTEHSLGDFYHNAVFKKDTFPVDAYMAEEQLSSE
jgi:hypothetical protein